MSLPNEEVLQILASDFVVGWSNIEKAEHVGLSHGYAPAQTAVGTTNGAGGRNVQILILSPDGVVLHALPGFWHPEDLAHELRFAKLAYRLWLDPDRSREDKEMMLRRMHERELLRQDPATVARSDWQGFDRWEEIRRCQEWPRDTVQTTAAGYPLKNERGLYELKPLNVLARERMMAQPFRSIADFDLEAFVDYGRAYYDNNRGDRGKPFPRAERRAQEREKEAAKERERQEREKARAEARQG